MSEIGAAVYKREIEICVKKYNESGGCKWGTCDNCGVLLHLHKLRTGLILDQQEEISAFKKMIFKRV